MRFDGEGVLCFRLKLVQGNDVTGLRSGGDGIIFSLSRSLELKSGDEVVGSRERDNDLVGSKRSDEGLSKDLIGGDTSVLRERRVFKSER